MGTPIPRVAGFFEEHLYKFKCIYVNNPNAYNMIRNNRKDSLLSFEDKGAVKLACLQVYVIHFFSLSHLRFYLFNKLTVQWLEA